MALFYDTFQKLAERPRRMEDRLAKNSKKSGGQAGFTGGTLTMREHFDTFKRPGETVSHCQGSLGKGETIELEKRLVFEVPPLKLEVTEHQAEIKECPVRLRMSVGEFPDKVMQPV